MRNTYNSTIHSPWSKSLQLSSVTLERPASVPHTRQQNASPHTTRLFIAPLNLILLLEIAPQLDDLRLFTVDRMTHNRGIGPPLVEPAGLSESWVFIGWHEKETGLSGSKWITSVGETGKDDNTRQLYTNDNTKKSIEFLILEPSVVHYIISALYIYWKRV